jgi:acid phosphatase
MPIMVAAAVAAPPDLPRDDHIVIVVEDNKGYEKIIDNSAAPYINKLASEGASFINIFAEEHRSQRNYS